MKTVVKSDGFNPKRDQLMKLSLVYTQKIVIRTYRTLMG